MVGNKELGGDPAPSIQKKLIVEYELAGRRANMTAAENSWLAPHLDNCVAEEAKWRRPGYLRKGFTLDGAVCGATVYATALGLCELRGNGQRVGDHRLAPQWTEHYWRVPYQTYDVTALVRSGADAMGDDDSTGQAKRRSGCQTAGTDSPSAGTARLEKGARL